MFRLVYMRLLWRARALNVAAFALVNLGDTVHFCTLRSQVRLALAGKAPLPEECIMHSGRSICKVEKYL